MMRRRFHYVALGAGGARDRGVIEAETSQDAYRALTRQGLTPIEVTGRTPDTSPTFSFQRITAADVADLTRELGVLVEARIPLARGLSSIAEHETKPALKAMILDVAASIEAGQPMTDALARYQGVFGEAYIETMRAAERSGNLARVITHLAEMLDRQIESRQQLKRALTYPLIVLGVVALAMVVIFVFVVPRFAETFQQQGVKLPAVTRIVQAIGLSARTYWYAYAGAAIAAAVSLRLAWRSPLGRIKLERVLARVPCVGSIILATLAGRFARVLSIGLGSGLNLIDALEISGRATGHHAFRAECRGMAERLRGGAPFTDVLRESRFMPGFARRMLGAGKDSDEIAKAGEIVARHFDREASHLSKNINSIIEPVLTVVLAVVVLVVALSVFIPMWQMVRANR